jgi:hypothetical protein
LAEENDGTYVSSEGFTDDPKQEPVPRRYHLECPKDDE